MCCATTRYINRDNHLESESGQLFYDTWDSCFFCSFNGQSSLASPNGEYRTTPRLLGFTSASTGFDFPVVSGSCPVAREVQEVFIQSGGSNFDLFDLPRTLDLRTSPVDVRTSPVSCGAQAIGCMMVACVWCVVLLQVSVGMFFSWRMAKRTCSILFQ